MSVAIIGLAASLYMAGEIATDTEVITLLKQMTTSNEISIGTLMRKISMAILVVGVFIVMAFFFGFFAAFYRSRPMHILVRYTINKFHNVKYLRQKATKSRQFSSHFYSTS